MHQNETDIFSEYANDPMSKPLPAEYAHESEQMIDEYRASAASQTETIHTITIDETDQVTLTVEVLDINGSTVSSETNTDIIPGIWALGKDEAIRDAVATHFGLERVVLGAPGSYSMCSGRDTYTLGGAMEA